MKNQIKRIGVLAALCALLVTGATTWLSATPASASPVATVTATTDDGDASDAPPAKHGKANDLTGKLNLNSATSDQLQLLPGVGPSKADRIVAWRKAHGTFKRVADLRKVKGFGYKTLKKLEPWLDVKGENTLAAK